MRAWNRTRCLAERGCSGSPGVRGAGVLIILGQQRPWGSESRWEEPKATQQVNPRFLDFLPLGRILRKSEVKGARCLRHWPSRSSDLDCGTQSTCVLFTGLGLLQGSPWVHPMGSVLRKPLWKLRGLLWDGVTWVSPGLLGTVPGSSQEKLGEKENLARVRRSLTVPILCPGLSLPVEQESSLPSPCLCSARHPAAGSRCTGRLEGLADNTWPTARVLQMAQLGFSHTAAAAHPGYSPPSRTPQAALLC